MKNQKRDKTKTRDIFQIIGEKIIITAEIGINHNGDLKLAEEMIDAAADCGADAVKFQAFKTEFMYSRFTPGFSHTDTDVFSQIKALEMQDDWWEPLRNRADKRGLYFSSSVFDHPSLKILENIGLDFVKIASSEIDNLAFIEEQLTLSPVFVVSTGTAQLQEISAAVGFLREKGIDKLILLECTSSYPAPPESIHLLNIDFLAGAFGVPAGFSDHTIGYHHSVAAAARGARFIEKHFTLDKNMAGPDHKISSDVKEMTQLVRSVREIEISLTGNRKTAPSPHESSSLEIGRKSLMALKNIRKGEKISKENTIIKRPGLGIKPMEAPYVYGRKAICDIDKDHWITWDMIFPKPS